MDSNDMSGRDIDHIVGGRESVEFEVAFKVVFILASFLSVSMVTCLPMLNLYHSIIVKLSCNLFPHFQALLESVPPIQQGLILLQIPSLPVNLLFSHLQ